jgi:hypothetical protein
MIEVRKIILREQAKLPPGVPEPPDLEDIKDNPKPMKDWLEKYHKSIVLPLQQQFREIQIAINNLLSTQTDSVKGLNSIETQINTPVENPDEPSELGKRLGKAPTIEAIRELLKVPVTNEVVKIVGDQTIAGNKTFIDVVRITGLPTFADEAAAISGGLIAGELYKTSTGELRIKL